MTAKRISLKGLVPDGRPQTSQPPAGQSSMFTLDEAFPDECGYMTREPRLLSEALDRRGLPGDAELADLFRNFGDVLPATLTRMSAALKAMGL